VIATVFPTIQYKYGQTFRIKPCFDWHFGHRYCDLRALKAYISNGYDDENCYVVGGGDIADSILPVDKRYRKSSDGLGEGDAAINYIQDGLTEMFLPYKGRILGLGLGNHEDTVLKKSGVHIIRELCRRLECKSLGYQWAITLNFSENGNRGHKIVIFGQHGWGGGTRTEGGSITKYSKHALYWDADIFFYGHDHRLEHHVIPFMGIRGEQYLPKNKHIILPGTFLRTFSKTDEPTWAETRGFHPAPLQGTDLYIKFSGRGFGMKIWSDTTGSQPKEEA
jgi:hypothetical protein